MAKYQKITDYQAKYLDVSKGIIDVLEKNDRQMEYLQYDIKAERCRIDQFGSRVAFTEAHVGGAPSSETVWQATFETSIARRGQMSSQANCAAPAWLRTCGHAAALGA